jgi:hypothetical protein
MTIVVLNHNFYPAQDVGENDGASDVSSEHEKRGSSLRIASIGLDLANEENSKIFKTMDQYLKMKIKDIKETLSSEKMNTELSDSKYTEF